MLNQIIIENWKSFQYAELHIDPLTVLVGTNASGKSNALDVSSTAAIALIFRRAIDD